MEPTKKNVAVCGIDCKICPAYIATKTKNQLLKESTAKSWSAMFNADIQAENINCTGCRQNGVKFAHCEKCDMRNCATGKKLSTCADCIDYPCAKLTEFFEIVPDAKINLETFR